MDEFSSEIEAEIANTWQQIAAATERRDQNALDQLNKKLAELLALKAQDQAIKSRVRILKNGSQPAGKAPSAMREFHIPVTQGMLNQSLLTLTDPVKRGIIRIGERMTIELPSGDRFDTILLPEGNKLQERGKIGNFYRNLGVQAGDVVVLTEVTPGQWKLKKQI
jgi:hypothetical protein